MEEHRNKEEEIMARRRERGGALAIAPVSLTEEGVGARECLVHQETLKPVGNKRTTEGSMARVLGLPLGLEEQCRKRLEEGDSEGAG